MENSSGQALTLVDGRIGAGVNAVTIERDDGSSVQATVSGGWYLAWWPGTARASTADVQTTTGPVIEPYPPTAAGPTPAPCPAGAHCASGYGFGGGPGSTNGGQMSIGGASGSR